MITYLFTSLVCEVSARKIMFQVLLDFTIFAYAERKYLGDGAHYTHSVHEHDTHWNSNTLKPCCSTSGHCLQMKQHSTAQTHHEGCHRTS